MEFPRELQYITNEKGEKSHAVVPMDFFMELLEDFSDIQFSKTRSESKDTITWQEFQKELINEGKLPDTNS